MSEASALLEHFGSFSQLARASVQELLPFLSPSKAAQLVSSLRLAAVALREERSHLVIDTPFRGESARGNVVSASRISPRRPSRHQAAPHQGRFRERGNPERSSLRTREIFKPVTPEFGAAQRVDRP